MHRKWDGRRRAYVHVGTHKTGTTALQVMLAANAEALAAAGFYFPRMGRPARLLGTALAGQHNLAWHLLGDGRYDPADGTLPHVIDEIGKAELPIVLLSSEDFGLCFDRPEVLAALRDSLRNAGYAPHIVVYLRPQRGYMQSLYAELVKQSARLRFDAFAEASLREGAFTISGYTMPLDYAQLLDPLAACFGEEHILVRPYAPGSDPGDLPRDFIQTVASGLPLRYEKFAPASFENTTATYLDLLHVMFASFTRRHSGLASIDDLLTENFGDILEGERFLRVPFSPFTADEDSIVTARFADSNARIRERFGITFAPEPALHDHALQRTFFKEIVDLWGETAVPLYDDGAVPIWSDTG